MFLIGHPKRPVSLPELLLLPNVPLLRMSFPLPPRHHRRVHLSLLRRRHRVRNRRWPTHLINQRAEDTIICHPSASRRLTRSLSKYTRNQLRGSFEMFKNLQGELKDRWLCSWYKTVPRILTNAQVLPPPPDFYLYQGKKKWRKGTMQFSIFNSLSNWNINQSSLSYCCQIW